MYLKRYLSASLVAAAVSLGAHALHAQGIVTGSLTGTVQDPDGAVVPGAMITATNTSTNQATKVKSTGSGEFNFTTLPVGVYVVTIDATGFGQKKIERVNIETGKLTGLGEQKLSTGQASETVEVSTGQNLLETVQSQVTTTFDAVEVSNLPTGGGFDELALLIPGVVATHSNNFSNTNGAGLSSNGQRGRNNNFEIDGQSNNDNSVAGEQVFFSNQDALQEIQVITNNYSAQYGRDAGTVINYVTKSGTNQIHGSAFYGYEGSWLTSLTQGQKGPQFGYCTPAQEAAGVGTDKAPTGTAVCTTPHKPRFDDNDFGGTIGFPIIRDKLFGFGSAYFSRNFNGGNTLNSGTIGGTTGYTPTPAGVAALAAAFPTNGGVQSLVKYGPYAAAYGTVAQIPGSTKTVTLTDGLATPTSVTIPVSLYSRTYEPFSTDEEVLGRLDYQATNKDRFFARYFYQNSPATPYNATVTGGIVFQTDAAHSVGADWTHTFGPRVVNLLRYSFQQANIEFQGGAFPTCTSANFVACPASVGISTAYPVASVDATTGAALNITPISSFGLSTSYPQGRFVKDTQIQDNLSLSFGKHSITVGGSFEYQNSPNTFLPNISGGYTLNGGNGLIQGTGTLGLANGNGGVHFTEPDIAAYFQDDYKATPSLTLNLGLRWEFFSQSINLLHNISAANQASGAPLWNPALPAVTTCTATACMAGTTFPQFGQQYKHFEPRLGFAYNPAGLKQMVIRGGYSINISPAFYNIFLNSYGSAPVVLSGTISGCNNTSKPCIPSGGAFNASVHTLDNNYLTGGTATQANASPVTNPGAYNETFVGNNFNQPTTQTYSLGVQYEVGRIAVVEVRYVGAHTSHDFQTTNGNPAIGATLANANAAVADFPSFFAGFTPCATATLVAANGPNAGQETGRQHCGETTVRNRTNTAFEVYNGLQTQVSTRNYHGLTATAAYTFSRTIDNASEIFASTGGVTSAFSQNPFDSNVGERGVSGNSYPNVSSLGLVYTDPHFKQSHSLVGRVLGGFQLNVIHTFNSGQPYTPAQTITSAQPGSSATPEGNFSDYFFDASFGSYSAGRPVLNNKSAPISSAALNCGNGLYIPLGAGAACPITSGAGTITPGHGFVSPDGYHWIVNNIAEAITKGSPYPGVGRNTLRGDSYNNTNASLFKNNKINERLNMQLQVTLFNALNRAYYGTPGLSIENAGPVGSTTFNTFLGNGGSNRNIQVGARLLF